MYDQQQTTQLDPLTQALITLKQGASPTTPNGQPTIAGQTMAAMQPQQPQMPPQGGLPGMLPQGGQPQQQGIASIAQNAATGNAIQQQQQQQAQEAMMQMAQQQQQQQQPQMMAEGGLAGLSAGNMGFAEGGIIPTMEYANGGLSLDLSKLYGQGFAPTPDMTGALPTEPESPEVAELRRLQAERVALDKQRIPELYTRGTEAVSAARNEAEAAQQQALKERGMDRLMAVLGAGAKSRFGAGEGYLNFQDATRKADALYAQQKQLLAMQQLEQDKYRYSLEAGSNTAAAEAGKNIAGIKDKLADNAFKIKQLAETARGTDVGAGVRREEITAADARSAAELASAEKRNLATIKSQERIAGMKGAGGVGAGRLDLATYKALADPLEKELESLRGGLQIKHAPDVARAQQIYKDLQFLRNAYGLPPNVGVPLGVPIDGAGGAGGSAELKYNPKTGKIE